MPKPTPDPLAVARHLVSGDLLSRLRDDDREPDWLAELTAECEQLRAENARLREALRWRTVATDGLPEVGVRVLVQREDEQEMYRCVVAKYAGEFWGWSIPGVGLGVSEQDRWLPVPEETL